MNRKKLSIRDKQLMKYRKLSLKALLDLRLHGSYEPSTIEQVILEKSEK